MLFDILVVTEVLLCLLLLAGVLQGLSDTAAPELDLGQRAWVAARFGMAEAGELGPLFGHLVRAARQGLRQAHVMQERIRAERERRSHRLLGPVLSPWQRWRTRRSAELAELSHLVEQLEQAGRAIARYRAGLGTLMELQVPLRCIHAAASARARRFPERPHP